VIEGTGEAVEVNGSQDEDPGGRMRVAGVCLEGALGGLSSKGRDLMQLMEVVGVLMGVVDMLSPKIEFRFHEQKNDHVSLLVELVIWEEYGGRGRPAPRH
jgi:hypothetical protein